MLNPPSTSVSSRPRRRPSSLAEAQDVQCGIRPDVDGRRIVFERNLLGELQVERHQDQVAADRLLDFFKATVQIAHVSLRPPNGLACTCGCSYSSAVPAGDRRVVRRPPQRVDEDPGRARDRADALDFPTGDPVVDGPAAHVDEFARPPDRDGCPVGRHRCDRQYASLRHRDHARQTGAYRPAEHPRPGVSASRHRGYSDRARPSVPRGREHVHSAGERCTRGCRRLLRGASWRRDAASVHPWGPARRDPGGGRPVAHAGPPVLTVRTAGETYILRQDVRSGGWELTGIERRHRS